MTHLLSQDDLPFKVKRLGSERCIDIFQVAEWLHSDADVAEVVSAPSLAASVGGAPMASSTPASPKTAKQPPAPPLNQSLSPTLLPKWPTTG